MRAPLVAQKVPLPIALHCALLVHPTQVSNAPQIGVVPLQPLPSAGSQPAQAPVMAPLVTHEVPPAAPAQSASPAQGPHVAVAAEHTGVVPLHPAAVVGSHAPQLPAIAPPVTHTVPVAIAVHSAVSAQPRHVPPLPQIGVAPPQSPSVVHSTQVFAPTSQTAPMAAQTDASPASQATQAPAFAPLSAHTGVAARPAHSPSLAQAAHASAPSAPARQMGVAPPQPAWSAGSQTAQRPSLRQWSRPRSAMHSSWLAQARHSVLSASQMGVVRVSHPSWVPGSQPPHAPEGVHTRMPGQLSGSMPHASHSSLALQIGVSPEQPELSLRSQSTQRPETHCRSVQSLASRHSTQAPAASSQSGVAPAQAGPSPHRHVRSTQALLESAVHAVAHASHCPEPVATQTGPLPPGQHSSLGPQPACVAGSQAPPSTAASIPPSPMRLRSNVTARLHAAEVSDATTMTIDDARMGPPRRATACPNPPRTAPRIGHEARAPRSHAGPRATMRAMTPVTDVALFARSSSAAPARPACRGIDLDGSGGTGPS